MGLWNFENYTQQLFWRAEASTSQHSFIIGTLLLLPALKLLSPLMFKMGTQAPFHMKKRVENWKGKSEKNTGRNKDSLLSKEGWGRKEVTQGQPFTTSHEQSPSKGCSGKTPPLLSVMVYGMEYTFGHFGSAVMAVFPSSLCSFLLPGGQREKERKPWHCASTVWQ